MKRLLYLIIDLLIIYGCIILAFYFLEFYDILEDFQRNFDAFINVVPYIGILYIVLVYAFRLYDIILKKSGEMVYITFLVSLFLMIGTMGICFLVRDAAVAFPRSVILTSTSLYFVTLTLWHVIIWYVNFNIHGTKKVIIIGNNYNRLVEILTNKYANYYHIEGVFPESDQSLSSKIESIDEVFLCSDVSRTTREMILPICIKYKKEVYFTPRYVDLSIMTSVFSKIDDVPTYRISNMELPPEEQFVKRMVDLVFGTIASIIALPFGIIIGIFIKLDGGQIFYAQERLTKDGKKFKMLKFRTMIPNAEQISGPVLAGKGDPRITKVGKYIRAIRMDEIPQLFNILKGEMSLVGPRPERTFFVEQFEKEIPEYQYRLKVKAGLTGLAQIEGKYNTTVEDKLLYDLIYINDYSLLRDFLIMLQTVKILFLKSSTEGVNA